MGRFRIETGSLKKAQKNPLSFVEDNARSLAKQAKKQLNITKQAAASKLKAGAGKFLSGDISDPSELLNPSDLLSGSRFSTLLGISDKQETPKYYTPFGAAATDYFVLRRKVVGRYLGDVKVADDTELAGATVISETHEFVDLSAMITISQKKNILMTRVEGRDRSRKEFISGGDFMVNISGEILSDKTVNKYPEEKVQMLRSMLTSNEVLNVESPILSRFGIDGLLILDFKLTQSRGSANKQAYQITAVHERPMEVLQSEESEKLTKMQEALRKVNEWVAVDTFLTKSL